MKHCWQWNIWFSKEITIIWRNTVQFEIQLLFLAIFSFADELNAEEAANVHRKHRFDIWQICTLFDFHWTFLEISGGERDKPNVTVTKTLLKNVKPYVLMLECRLSLSFIADSNKIQRKATDTAYINYNNNSNSSDYEYDQRATKKRIKRNNHKRKQEKWHIVQCITSVFLKKCRLCTLFKFHVRCFPPIEFRLYLHRLFRMWIY